MYIICKFLEQWSMYDEVKNSSRSLDKNEIESLKTLMPGLLNDHTKMLVAVRVTSINPSKLTNLSLPAKNGTPKKAGEPS